MARRGVAHVAALGALADVEVLDARVEQVLDALVVDLDCPAQEGERRFLRERRTHAKTTRSAAVCVRRAP